MDDLDYEMMIDCQREVQKEFEYTDKEKWEMRLEQEEEKMFYLFNDEFNDR